MPRTRKSKSPLFQARHYEAIAAVLLKEHCRELNALRASANLGDYAGAVYSQHQANAFYTIALELAVMFKADNPKFDAQRFMNAARHRTVSL